MPVAEATELELRFAKAERINIAPSGKRFRANFIVPGLISYKDVKGGVDLVRKEVIDRCLSTMIGAALTIKHPSKAVIISRDFSEVSHGNVDAVGYDEPSGFYFAEGPIETDAARERINAGDGVSCGFTVLESGPAGTWGQIPYTQEDTSIDFHHLALVDNPRIEEADIRFNAKNMNPIVKFIRKIAGAAGAAPTEETRELSLSTRVDIGGGKTATLQDLVDAERANAVHQVMPEDHFECDGVRYNVAEAIAKLKAHPDNMENKENAVLTAEQKLAKEKEDAQKAIDNRIKEERDNAVKEERDRVEKENALARGAASFTTLRNAPAKAAATDKTEYNLGDSGSLDDQVALGRERYGRPRAGLGKN